MKDKVSVFIFEYNQKYNLILLVKRIQDDLTKFKGHVQPYQIKVFNNYVSIINQFQKKQRFYDTQDMDDIFMQCTKSIEKEEFKQILAS